MTLIKELKKLRTQPFKHLRRLKTLGNNDAGRAAVHFDNYPTPNNKQPIKKTDTPADINIKTDCKSCRNASFDGLTCYYAALHPSDKSFKSRVGISNTASIIKNCNRYQKRNG